MDASNSTGKADKRITRAKPRAFCCSRCGRNGVNTRIPEQQSARTKHRTAKELVLEGDLPGSGGSTSILGAFIYFQAIAPVRGVNGKVKERLQWKIKKQ